jgi:hypothetical protein
VRCLRKNFKRKKGHRFWEHLLCIVFKGCSFIACFVDATLGQNLQTRFPPPSVRIVTGESVGNMLIVIDDGDDRKDAKQILTALALVSTKLT